MTNLHENNPGNKEKDTLPTQGSATLKFAKKLERSFAYNAPRETREYTDGEAIALLDLPGSIQEGDVSRVQTILEGNLDLTQGQQDRYNVDRLSALKELHEAEQGAPSADDLRTAMIQAKLAIHEVVDDPIKRTRLIDGFNGTAETREQVIALIEDRISELNVFPDDPNKMLQREHLRTARDKLFTDYKDLIETTQETEVQQARDARRAAIQDLQEKAADEVRTEIEAIYGADKAKLVDPDNNVRVYTHEDMVAMGLREPKTKTGGSEESVDQPPKNEDIQINTEPTPAQQEEEDPEVARLRTLGFGDTAKAQKEALAASESTKALLDQQARKRREDNAKKQREEDTVKKGKIGHSKDTQQKRREEAALLEVFTVLQEAAEQQPQVEVETTQESQEKKEEIAPSKPEREPRNADEMKKELEKANERKGEAAVHAAFAIINQIPSDIRQNIFMTLGEINPAIINPSQEALEALDLSTFNIQRFGNLYAKWNHLTGGRTPGPDFWNEVRSLSGGGQLGRTAEEARTIIRELADTLKEAQKDAEK